MRTIILIMVLLASVSLVAQENIDSILFSIEENNSTLKALREETNAQKLGNKTGIYLSDPDVEFGYLWGNPERSVIARISVSNRLLTFRPLPGCEVAWPATRISW